jgi:hypothetical protein
MNQNLFIIEGLRNIFPKKTAQSAARTNVKHTLRGALKPSF